MPYQQNLADAEGIERSEWVKLTTGHVVKVISISRKANGEARFFVEGEHTRGTVARSAIVRTVTTPRRHQRHAAPDPNRPYQPQDLINAATRLKRWIALDAKQARETLTKIRDEVERADAAIRMIEEDTWKPTP